MSTVKQTFTYNGWQTSLEEQRFEPLLKIYIKVRENNISSKCNGTISIDTPTEYDIDSHKVASNNKLPLASAGKKKNDFMKTFSIAE